MRYRIISVYTASLLRLHFAEFEPQFPPSAHKEQNHSARTVPVSTYSLRQDSVNMARTVALIGVQHLSLVLVQGAVLDQGSQNACWSVESSLDEIAVTVDVGG